MTTLDILLTGRSERETMSKTATNLETFLSQSDDVVAECAYLNVLETRKAMGLSRIRMGALLCVLEDSGGWRGKTASRTFRGFLVEEGIEPKAAYQYMEVARRFVLELKCAQHQLENLASASMRALSLAAKVADELNLNEVIDTVVFLPRPEAMEVLADMLEARRLMGLAPSAGAGKAPRSKPVSRILDQVGDLTLDQKAELYQTLRVSGRPPSAGVQAG